MEVWHLSLNSFPPFWKPDILDNICFRVFGVFQLKIKVYILCLIHVTWTKCWMSKLVLNVKYLLLLSFLTAAEFYNLGHIQGTYYKGVLTQKRSFVVICTTFRSAFHVSWKNQNKHSTLNSSFNIQMTWTRQKSPNEEIQAFFWRISKNRVQFY